MKLSIVGLAFAASAFFTPATANADGIRISGQITLGDGHNGPQHRANRSETNRVQGPTYGSNRAPVVTNVTRPRVVTQRVITQPVYSNQPYRPQQTHQGHQTRQGIDRKRAVRSCKRAIRSQYGNRVSSIQIEDVNRIEKFGPDKFRIFASVASPYGRRHRQVTYNDLICVSNGAGDVFRIRDVNARSHNVRSNGHYGYNSANQY